MAKRIRLLAILKHALWIVLVNGQPGAVAARNAVVVKEPASFTLKPPVLVLAYNAITRMDKLRAPNATLMCAQ